MQIVEDLSATALADDLTKRAPVLNDRSQGGSDVRTATRQHSPRTVHGRLLPDARVSPWQPFDQSLRQCFFRSEALRQLLVGTGKSLQILSTAGIQPVASWPPRIRAPRAPSLSHPARSASMTTTGHSPAVPPKAHPT